MTSYELWLFLHLTAAIVWIGGAITAQVFGVLAKRSGDPGQSAALGRNLGFVGMYVFLPSAIVVVLTGGLLVEDGNWDWGEPFVILGLVGWAVVVAAAFGYVVREMGKAGARMAAEGPSPELAARVGTLVLIARVLIVVLVAIVFVMVVKPGT
jgi:uncharacterized membrane protein